MKKVVSKSILAIAGFLIAMALTGCDSPLMRKVTAPPITPEPGGVTVVAAGDIACDPATPQYNSGNGTEEWCQMRATSDAVIAMKPTAVLALGDLQYEQGTTAAFAQSYDPTWGRFKPITYPAPGNHEYYTSGASGYFAYWGDRAGRKSEGWYRFDLGNWHLISLNSNCGQIGGCGRGSAQEQWLKHDLESNTGKCVVAYWHDPRFSSGLHGGSLEVGAFWEDLYKAHADLVLNGHDHDYEVFAPMAPDGRADPANGIREMVVGTGGKNRRGFLRHVRGRNNPNSEVRTESRFGVLRLTLLPDRYYWQFVAVPKNDFNDYGTATCHSAAK